MKKPIFDFTVEDAQVQVNSREPGTGFAWGKLFPLKYTPDFTIKGIEGEDGLPVSADKVAFNAKSPLKSRQKVGSWSGKLAKIAIGREKDEEDIVEYQDLKLKAANHKEDRAMARKLVDIVYDDVTFCQKGIDAKVEVDALRIGSSGKQTFVKEIDGDNVTADEINFNVPTDNFGGAKTVWSNVTAADGLKDIADAAAKVAKKGFARPRYAFMAKEKFEELCAQQKTAKRLFPLNQDLLTAADAVDLDTVNRYMTKKGWPTIITIDSYVNIQDKEGNDTPIQPWDKKVVTLSPVPYLGYTYYKTVPTVPNSPAEQVYGPKSFFKLTRFSTLDPMAEKTMAEAYIQPGLANRKSLVFINTENAGAWE